MSVTLERRVSSILLIVEDQLLLALGLAEALEERGYTVLKLATRCQEALELAIEFKPDLALVNIELEQGDDGVSLARDLINLGIPVLFISGQPDRARSACAFGVASLAKPYSAEELVESVNYLFRHRAGDESRPGPRRLEMFDPIAAHA
jgi:DNA-binding response OmpR family regulator